MIASLLIANRGEIARRIVRTARRLGIRTIAVATEADRSWPHWREADEAVFLGAGPVADSYLSIERILDAARRTGAEAIHPGYGFLSENAAFAEACGAAGLVFVGPPAAAIRAMGSKADAKALMQRAGVPVVPGYHGERQEPAFLKEKAYEIGYPVLIKAVAGGGGRGMRRVDRALDFETALEGARREAKSGFGDDRVLIERYVATPRHIEIQVFADAHGGAIHLHERDCSVQRRHQKVLEEAPAPGLPEAVRRAMGAAAVQAARAVSYRGAGTVEFIADAAQGLAEGGFYFMEMNTRLQVEHPVTEMVTSLDLVEWQLRIASGEPLPLRQEEVPLAGHAVEARLYAEDPRDGFRPTTGTVWAADFPSGEGIRVDAGVEAGSAVGPFYDSLLGKIVAFGADRGEALARLDAALAATRIAGPATNLPFLAAVARHPAFAAGGVDTGFVDRELAALAGERPDPAGAGPAIEAWLAARATEFATGAPGPWRRSDAFQLTGLGRRNRLAVTVDGEDLVAEVAWPEGRPEVVSVGGRAAARAGAADIVWGGGAAHLLTAAGQLVVRFPDPRDREIDAPVGGGRVVVPMHGRIVHLAVSPGQAVAPGDPLFTLEAMKMEHTVVAPIAGLVEAVHVAAGAQVEQGALAVVVAVAGEGG